MSIVEGTKPLPKGRQFPVDGEGTGIIQELAVDLRLNQPDVIKAAVLLLRKHTAGKRVQTVEETFAQILGD